jgi:alanine dehydrogenase
MASRVGPGEHDATAAVAETRGAANAVPTTSTALASERDPRLRVVGMPVRRYPSPNGSRTSEPGPVGEPPSRPGYAQAEGSREVRVIVGVPREVKDNEYRVALTPEGARELSRAGHRVLLEEGAGEGSSLTGDRYERAGAEIVPSAALVWESADMVLKVKEPIETEYERMQEGQILFTYLHLAASKELTQALLDRKVQAVAYETVQDDEGRLPLLAPMSEVAGRMAPHVGAMLQEKEHGGRGVLLGGVSGVRPAKVLVLGAGMAGANAAWIAAGMEAEVIVVDKNLDKLRFIDQVHKGRILTLMSDQLTLEQRVRETDVLIGSVLVPGARAPKLITEDMVASMRPGSVIIDIAIDQGGCVETSRMTTHSDPTYVEHGVVHYCVGNMPGAVPNTSTYALTNVTLRYALQIAERGLEDAVREDPALAWGVNAYGGQLTNTGVAEAHGMEPVPLSDLVDGVQG